MSSRAAEETTRVPGQVDDPTRVAGEHVSFAGAGGDAIGGYVVSPAPVGVYPGCSAISKRPPNCSAPATTSARSWAASASAWADALLRERLREVAHETRVDVYDGAGHAFLNDTRPEHYRPEPASRLWEDAVTFLDRHLKD
jgi:dienelactone hydrolase